MASPNQTLTHKEIQHRIPHSYPELNIPGFSLESLEMPYIYIFGLDLLPFPGQYRFLSYSSAIQYLSPAITSGLKPKQAEVKSRGLQRNCNFHNPTKTEVGLVYVARHPSLVNRSRNT